MRLTRWAATVLGMACAGLVAGWWAGGAMEGFSPDYPGGPADLGGLGLRLGVVVGCAVGACEVIGSRPPTSGWGAVRAAAVAGGTAIAVTGGLLALLYVDEVRSLFTRHVLDARLDRLVSPRRYVVYRAVSPAAVLGALSGALAGGVIAWRGRGGAA